MKPRHDLEIERAVGPLDVGSLLREVTVSLGDLAAQRQVKLVCPELEQPLTLHGDPRQLRTALTCLLRNGIEAAPVGWHGRPYLLNVTLPPLGLVMFKRHG